jgi:diguanylate cyclase (GGDEF)-like protein
MHQVGARLIEAAQTAQPLAVILLDLDNFKRINDTHGHLAGDLVLRAIADRLKGQLRDDDLIGRFGGDEFAVLLPGTGGGEASRIAERLRASIVDEPIVIGDGRRDGVRTDATISIGVAEIATGCDLTDLIAGADAALYRAKNAGRNRVCSTADLPA